MYSTKQKYIASHEDAETQYNGFKQMQFKSNLQYAMPSGTGRF
jgi:hypothetical protein